MGNKQPPSAFVTGYNKTKENSYILATLNDHGKALKYTRLLTALSLAANVILLFIVLVCCT